MLDKYLMYYDKDKVGILKVDYEEDIWIYEPLEGAINQPHFVLKGYNNKEFVKTFVLNRAPEENYECIDALIKRAKLKEYDAYGFFKYNKGNFITDKFHVEMLEGVKVYTHEDFTEECRKHRLENEKIWETPDNNR